MAVILYHKPTGQAGVFSFVDTKEILANPDSEYTLEAPGGDGTAGLAWLQGDLLIAGLTPEALGALKAKGLGTVGSLIGRQFEEIVLTMGQDALRPADWSALREWHMVAAQQAAEHRVMESVAALGSPAEAAPPKRGPGRPPRTASVEASS